MFTLKDKNVGHVFNVTPLTRHATSVTYKVEAIFGVIAPKTYTKKAHETLYSALHRAKSSFHYPS